MNEHNESILDRILRQRRERIAVLKQERPVHDVREAAMTAPFARHFAGALKGGGIKLIAEIKRASPSKGWLKATLDPASLAREYQSGGAAAISVLTEPDFFHGSFEDLGAAREAVSLPVLCKDFVFDRYQVYLARAHQADAILLIAAASPAEELRDLRDLAEELGMAALVETHDEAEVEKAIASGATIVGINNRNLADFSVDIGTTLRLRKLVPAGVTVVSESGISTREEVLALERAGVNAVLVGETLVKAPDPARAIRDLLGGTCHSDPERSEGEESATFGPRATDSSSP